MNCVNLSKFIDKKVLVKLRGGIQCYGTIEKSTYPWRASDRPYDLITKDNSTLHTEDGYSNNYKTPARDDIIYVMEVL